MIDNATIFICSRCGRADAICEAVETEQGYICFGCHMSDQLTDHWDRTATCILCGSTLDVEDMIYCPDSDGWLCFNCDAGLFEAKMEHGK
jgi:hypothetical protein